MPCPAERDNRHLRRKRVHNIWTSNEIKQVSNHFHLCKIPFYLGSKGFTLNAVHE